MIRLGSDKKLPFQSFFARKHCGRPSCAGVASHTDKMKDDHNDDYNDDHGRSGDSHDNDNDFIAISAPSHASAPYGVRATSSVQVRSRAHIFMHLWFVLGIVAIF